MLKKFAIAFLLLVLMFVCTLPVAAQKKKQQIATQPTAKPAPVAPAQPAATTPKPATEQAGALQGKVVDLGWGDSVTVLDAQSKQHRVRLLGIDAPEKEQAFGPAARQKLSALVFGKMIAVKYQKMDRNGRPLGKVLLGTTDVNLEMLKAGLAWYYANDSDLPATDRPLYANAERDARAAGRGLWQDEGPVPPWEFRQARKQKPPPGMPGNESATDPALTASNAAAEKSDEDDAITAATAEKLAGSDKDSDAGSEKGDASTKFPKAPKETVTGDSSSKIYYRSSCPEVEKVSPQNRISFGSVEDAEKAGFRRTPNCP